ncbi:hypothetical protein JZ751_029746 [Albula glossodonta]|uniref:Uncharacterized protein n=1 Tax=Albula glossodonta TaxID=121402 RepID=A0A8T2N9Y1_9TELE|nr:hypothetical protein JZ751_029746 [Albula glossodonta]
MWRRGRGPQPWSVGATLPEGAGADRLENHPDPEGQQKVRSCCFSPRLTFLPYPIRPPQPPERPPPPVWIVGQRPAVVC